MNSNNESKPMTNSAKPDGEDKSKNIKGTPKQSGQGDNDKVFYETATQSSNFVPLNGSQSVTGNSSNCIDTPPSCTSNDRACSASQPVCVNNVNSSDCLNDCPTTSSSRSSPNTNNGSDYNDVPCTRHKVTDKTISMAPSTSGTSRTSDNDIFVNKETRKRPSSLKLNRPNLDNDSSSDTGNDDYSLGSEDGCIYTYRGGEHLADLPSSFFSLDMGLPLDRHLPIPHNYQAQHQPGNQREGGSRASSPDMDFLEMDFDPGPSCEVDTGDESTPDADLDMANNMPEESEPVIRGTTPEYSAGVRYNPSPSIPVWHQEDHTYSQPSTSRGPVQCSNTDTSQQIYGTYIMHVNVRGEQLLVRRTVAQSAPPATLHILNGDLLAQKDPVHCPEALPDGSFAYNCNRPRYQYDVSNAVTPSSTYHITMAKKLIADKSKREEDASSTVVHSSLQGAEPPEAVAGSSTSISVAEPPRSMVWSEKEACERQVTQIAVSACGATAVVNVFNALGVPVNKEKIIAAVGTRLRANNAPLPRYLLSRSVAGCTASDIVSGIHRASDGVVTARFFPTHPERAVSLSHWLADWISLGAVPILTLNLQHGAEGEIPDAWHHQMVFGVSSHGVYLSNPVGCIGEGTVWSWLAAPSLLLVRAKDVVARFTPTTDLTPLTQVPNVRWHTYNVLGQVANVLREWRAAGWQEYGTRTRHITIPAAYQAGITIAALTGSEAHRRLMVAPQLPILAPQITSAPQPSTSTQQISAAQQGTSGPQPSTSGPQQSTSGPQQSTSGPQPSTSGTQQSTSGPQQSTSGPQQSTSGPLQSTSGPQPSTSGPQQSTSGPQQSTSGLQQSTSGLQQSTSGLQQSTSGPQQSTSGPQQSTSGPQQSILKPQQNMSASQQGPVTAGSVSVPQQSTSVIQSISCSQQTISDSQQGSDSARSLTAAQQSASGPQLRISGPQQCIAGPQPTISGPQQSMSEPQQNIPASQQGSSASSRSISVSQQNLSISQQSVSFPPRSVSTSHQNIAISNQNTVTSHQNIATSHQNKSAPHHPS